MSRERDLHDFYFREAKREGYRSRAAYKLIELDDRRGLLEPGARVLDCGCAPGSWMQVAAQRVGPMGVVVGVDLKPLHHPMMEDNVTVLVGDLREMEAEILRGNGAFFDVVLSDMAPSTTGDRSIDHHGSIRLCHAVLDRLPELLRPGGRVALKAFEGEAYPELLARMRAIFGRVKGYKPKASRAISTEMYVVGHDYQPGRADPARVDSDRLAPPRPRPSAGWGA